MPFAPEVVLALAFWAFVCGMAMLFGRTPEKIIGAATVVNEILYLIVYHPNDNVRAQWEAMVIDLVFAIVIAVVAIKYNRTWAKWAAAFELLIVGTHLAVGLDLRIATYFGYWSAALWTQAMLWALLIGTIQVILERRRAKKAALTT
jgi:hypothetical protein